MIRLANDFHRLFLNFSFFFLAGNIFGFLTSYISLKLYRVTGEIGYIVHEKERDINGREQSRIHHLL
jgi:hypothetical protein